ncbi:MAG: molybdopterin molybdotransferase MoeA [Bacteroidales bacterium]|nr:molybdopterin molybdotransferase MoeA [Bacteroidales bacterium]
MLTLNEAYKVYNKIAFQLPVEEVSLTTALNRVLSEDIITDINMPPFDKSAVDGYAFCADDQNKTLQVIDAVYAGSSSVKKVNHGTCIKITTGAPVPKGADAVVMIEDITDLGDGFIEINRKPAKSNICKMGEDIVSGETILEKGTLILPQQIAVLASAGNTKPKVFTLPRVAIIATGNEIIEPDREPNASQIRNSNSYNLLGQLLKIGITGNYMGIVADDKDDITGRLKNALNAQDIVIITGGVSVGEHDYIPYVLEELGLELQFDKLAIQPGKPVSFASSENKFCFGLSGNPVSSFLQFELLVKPLIYKIMNYEYKLPFIVTELSGTLKRKNAERLKFVPVKLDKKGAAREVAFNGSADIVGLTKADGFAMFPKDCEVLTTGEKVEVLLIL